MIKNSFKINIIPTLISSAKTYKEYFIDYEYLIFSRAFKNQSFYIIHANPDNFLHLTGVHSKISPKDFFDKCINGTI